nr:hypothetical protein [Xenorhabdus japonica]
MDNIGKNGINALAINTKNTFPKFELAFIFKYLMVFPNVSLSLITPSSNTIKFFSSRMISSDFFAISGAISTEIPTSVSRNTGSSFISSLRKLTV